ncbi:RNA polymerase sigma factor [Haliscomenobacter hydrossis]|uniref:RNA polymerase sigma factor, sigma-70 family n=1 Tax=Haliscomenobacter hydrossis (strain ATCC 27775 / DSM 1100 / LMG 10767 / O) TaxID=760192 RepID=F4KUL3_HALH1|nr:sigma-70 family RNA polymerase sigma factor [Haliscomenobacter hydrossis]AEE52449.1 RNA polymerase sigma factor, sigma-70 family [Haliscomenobacter hydrossis DSM 1100]
MSKNQLSDDQLLKMITGNETERDEAMRYIFHSQEWQNMIKYYVLQHKGNEQDGEDAFQETMILFDRNLRLGVFKGQSSLKTYFMAIAKWHWLGQLRKKHPQQEFSVQQHETQEESVEVQLINSEKKNFLTKALEQIGERCKNILELYKLHYSMQEIADQFAFSSADMAKKEAYRCRMKLRDFFENNPEWLNRVK